MSTMTYLAKKKPGSIPVIKASTALIGDVLRSAGKQLDENTRTHFESRFGHDFSQVRVHTDELAAESALSMNARAYTIGNHVIFSAGRYAPQTSAGLRLLAHELTHVAQQAGQLVPVQIPFSQLSSRAEAEASQQAACPMSAESSVSKISSTPVVLARQLEIPYPQSLPDQPPMTMASNSPSVRGMIAAVIALGEVGVRENPAGSNRGSCASGATRGCVDAYTGGRAQPWCAHFVSWSFEQTGFSPFGHVAAVSALRSWGRSTGWYVERAAVTEGRFTPLFGDIFTKPRYEGVGPERRLVGGHTGFVIRYDASSRMLETVEGNTGDRVQLRTRSLNELDGFIRVGR